MSLYRKPEYWANIDTSEFKKWRFMNAEKKILGYTCKPALSINEKNDSILVWYTEELKYKKGFLFYFGIPGIVLEVYDQRGVDVHLIAFDLKETDIPLSIRKSGIIIPDKKFYVIRDSNK